MNNVLRSHLPAGPICYSRNHQLGAPEFETNQQCKLAEYRSGFPAKMHGGSDVMVLRSKSSLKHGALKEGRPKVIMGCCTQSACLNHELIEEEIQPSVLRDVAEI